MENLEQFYRAWGALVQGFPDEVQAMLKRNGVFTPDNADLPTLNKMSATALGTSAAFRADAAKWAQSKASDFSNAAGWYNTDGDPVTGSAVVGGSGSTSTGGKFNWDAFARIAAAGLNAWSDTTAARYNAQTAESYMQAQQVQNQQSGNTTPPASGGGIKTGTILMVVALVAVVGGTIFYFTRKK